MKRNLLTLATLLAVSTSAFAGGLLTNTNQHAAFLRNPARQAIIGIDGVYTNPAGVAFMPQGFHLGVTWQAAFQKRQMNVTNPLYSFNVNNPSATRDFEGKATAPVIPSLQAAYVINDKWSVSANFAVAGGGGKAEFDNGLPMFEEMIGGSLVKAGAGYSFNQNLIGEQYIYGLQLGATYKITENFSVFGGVRGVLANCAYTGAISNIMAYTKGSSVPASAYLEGVYNQANAAAQQYRDAGMEKEANELEAAAQAAKQGMYLMQTDFRLDCEQNAFGLQPIIGANLKLGKLNLAAKYEFRAKINLENESKNSQNVDLLMDTYADGKKVRSDIPALLSVGAQYEITNSIRANVGVNYYFDKDAKGSATAVSEDTYEITIGGEWDIDDKWTVGIGGQRTKYGFAAADMKDTNFNISSYGLCIGGAYKINDMLKVNVGYLHSFYKDHKFTNPNGTACNYTRKNDVVGVSLDFKF